MLRSCKWKNLIIKAQKDRLEVCCNVETGIVEMNGTSYPEDAFEFFEPICLWVESYIKEEKTPLMLNLKIDYMNSSSTKCMFDIMELFENFHGSGGNASINWYFKENDKDIEETGFEFKEDMDVPFNVISY